MTCAKRLIAALLFRRFVWSTSMGAKAGNSVPRSFEIPLTSNSALLPNRSFPFPIWVTGRRSFPYPFSLISGGARQGLALYDQVRSWVLEGQSTLLMYEI